MLYRCRQWSADMILMKLLYLLTVAVLMIFYVLYIDTIALIMLLCVLAVPLIMKGILLILKYNSAAALTCDTDTFSAGESIPFTITLRNQSPFAFPQAQAIIELHHSFGTEKEKLRLRFPLQARNVTKMTFYVHANFCGSVNVTLKKLFVLDYFHLFRTGLRMRQKQADVLILPKRLSLPLANLAEPVLTPDGELYGDRPGDDPSEIFGFHEYTAGDPISRIHWKLSTKSDKLMMKEFSTPIQKSVLLLLDITSDAQKATHKMKETETILTIFYSIVCQMLEEQIQPTICWYHTGTQGLEQHVPATMGQLTDVFRKLYEAVDFMELDVQAVTDAVGEMRFSSVTCITTRLPEPMLTMIDRQLTANQKNILLVGTANEERRFLSDETIVLQVHPETVQDDIVQLVI